LISLPTPANLRMRRALVAVPLLHAATRFHPIRRSMATTAPEKNEVPPFVFAGIQLAVGADKKANLRAMRSSVERAGAELGARVVCLPECFNSPYGTQYFDEYAEVVDSSDAGAVSGESGTALAEAARSAGVYLIGGSIPERGSNGELYNTCLAFGPDGKLLAKHRKMHLFDISVPGGITFRESETLSAGDDVTHIDTPYGRFGIGICYDIRFPELAHLMAVENKCDMLVYPGAFNMTTGPMHWELLARSRAVDNQVHLAVVSPARDESATYHAWGHTSIVDPWGEVIATTEEKEGIVTAEIDYSKNANMQSSIPVRSQKRHDVYQSPALRK
jgi:omega-amidase